MVVAGIIAEYNPLHNGHLYQIQKVKEHLNPDYIIVALGNNFTQRGEVSIFNKFDKAKLALELGVDLVIEIPTVFSVSSAEGFAKTGVTLLNNTNVVTHLCFGAETNNIEKIMNIASTLVKEPLVFKKELKKELSDGISYAIARSNAIYEIYKNDKEINEIMSLPNNILAVEYCKELIRSKSKIKPYIIKRNGPGFYETEVTDNISSATNIRQMLLDKKTVDDYVPDNVIRFLSKCKTKKLTINDYSDLLLYRLRTIKKEDLQNIYEIKEGLENTILEISKSYTTISDIIEKSKSKRFTYTGISRAITNIILNITKDSYKKSLQIMPKYIRVLGFKNKSSALLSEITKKSKATIITNVNKYLKDKKSNKDICNELYKEIEYNNIYQIKANNDVNSDYTKNMIVI